MPCDHLDVEPIQERGPHEYLFILNSRDDETVGTVFDSVVLWSNVVTKLPYSSSGLVLKSRAFQTTRSRFRISSRNLSGSAGKP